MPSPNVVLHDILKFFVVSGTIFLWKINCDIVKFLNNGRNSNQNPTKWHTQKQNNVSSHSLLFRISAISLFYHGSFQCLCRQFKFCFQWCPWWRLNQVGPIKGRVQSSLVERQNRLRVGDDPVPPVIANATETPTGMTIRITPAHPTQGTTTARKTKKKEGSNPNQSWSGMLLYREEPQASPLWWAESKFIAQCR